MSLPLTNTNFKNCWFKPRTRATARKLPKLIKFLFKSLLKIYFKFNTRLVHFFVGTKIGFAFYVLCIVYHFYSHNDINNTILANFNTFLFYLIINTSVGLWFLLKIPFSRRFLEGLLTKKYLIRYLGKYN